MTDASQLPALADEQLERTVLEFLVHAFPEQLTLEELTLELATDPEAYGERDAIRRAVRDLAGAGLIHRHGSFVFPTHASLRLHHLLFES
jgi:hypothetical protein